MNITPLEIDDDALIEEYVSAHYPDKAIIIVFNPLQVDMKVRDDLRDRLNLQSLDFVVQDKLWLEIGSLEEAEEIINYYDHGNDTWDNSAIYTLYMRMYYHGKFYSENT